MPSRIERFDRVARLAPPAVVAGLFAGCAGEYPQTTFRPVTDFGALLNAIFADVFWWTMLVMVIVFGVLAYVVVRFRARPGAAPPRKVYGHTGLEMAWTLGPAFIVTFMLVPTIQGIFQTYQAPSEGTLVVEAVGHQWWWEFRYPQYEIVTANELHLPVGRPIEVRLSSADVLHNFWVPRLGGKRYNYPVPAGPAEGRPDWNRLVFTVSEAGVYSGQCAEYCGLSHALMRMRVVAQSTEDFEAWMQEMRTPPAPAAGSLAAQGQEIFLRSTCIACHAIEGTPAQGQIGPNLTNLGERWAVGAGVLDNTPANLARWIRNPQAVKPGALMPGTQEGAAGMPPTNLSQDEVEAVAAYLESL